MRASERARKKDGASGVILTMTADDGACVRVDAVHLTPEQIRAWVCSHPRELLEAIVYDAVMAARGRRPRL